MINYYGTKEEHLERELTGANIKRVRQNSAGIMLFAVITEHGVHIYAPVILVGFLPTTCIVWLLYLSGVASGGSGEVFRVYDR